VPGDAAVTGVAMLAGLGAGRYADVAEALARCVRLDPAIEPDPSAGPPYAEAFERYRRLVASRVVRAEGPEMRLRLGVSACSRSSAGLAEDWAPIVAGRLGLRLVQHSLDLVDPWFAEPADEPGPAGQLRSVADAHGLGCTRPSPGWPPARPTSSSTPTFRRRIADEWFASAIDFTAAVGGQAWVVTSGAFSVPDWVDPDRAAPGGSSSGSGSSARGMLARRAVMPGRRELAAAAEPSTMAMIGDLLDDGDGDRVPVRLCLDVGHMSPSGSAGDDGPYAPGCGGSAAGAHRPAPAIGRRGRPPLALHR
jgi:hypothetical protein